MARETKTIQCYPDDDKINKVCSVQASFGWELIGNQRCREQETFGEYVRTSTFHKLSFSREKNSPWYAEVTELENNYQVLCDSEPVCYANKPGKTMLFWGIMGLIFGVLSLLLLWGMELLSFAFFIPLALFGLGVLLLSILIARHVHYNRAYGEYLSKLSSWKADTGKQAEEIRMRADALVNDNI